MKKKMLLIIMTMAMLIQMSAYAYSDINNSSQNSAVNTLSGFGIINGYDDGTFKPDNNITRAEFAKIVIATIGADSNPMSTETFYDVENEHWAKSYIYIAKSMNIINGTTDTSFSPNDNVTYEQAIKMIIAALGYWEEAENNGGYPYGYISVADRLGITNGVVYENQSYATRGNIAVLVCNALNVPYYTMWFDGNTLKKEISTKTLYESHSIMKQLNSLKDDSTLFYNNDETVYGVG